jgi:hypothetical protein
VSSFASEFLELCPQLVIWEALTGRDQYGKPTYAAAKTYRGRRQYKISRVGTTSGGKGIRGEGAELISESQIYILPFDANSNVVALPAVGYDDKVYISGDTLYPPILSITKSPDETGVDACIKVMLGSANG